MYIYTYTYEYIYIYMCVFIYICNVLVGLFRVLVRLFIAYE